jgi:hypothetical protein
MRLYRYIAAYSHYDKGFHSYAPGGTVHAALADRRAPRWCPVLTPIGSMLIAQFQSRNLPPGVHRCVNLVGDKGSMDQCPGDEK